MLQTTGAGLAGAGLSTVAGTASAAGINLPPLARDKNLLVDPQGEEVKLAGVSIADPGEASRSWRHNGQMDSEGVVAMATGQNGSDFSNTLIRVPMQGEFIYTGTGAANGPDEADMPHGDDWGPALPGTYDQTQLQGYLSSVIDPLVSACEEYGAYIMLDYHRHYPVFHHTENEEYVEDGQPIDDACYDDLKDGVWFCDSDDPVDHTQVSGFDGPDFPTRPNEGRHGNACGERGLLWHGEDQIPELENLIDEHAIWEYDFAEEANPPDGPEDVYLEPPEVCNALDAELTQFWETVAEEYGDNDHVIFDIYNEPTGPYAGDWGGPERKAGELSDAAISDAPELEMWGEYAEPYHELWHERSEPWVQITEDLGGGQVKTIGNPRWSQYTYWAPYYEYDVENMAYTSHVYLQDNCRPLEDTVGSASEIVPVFFSEFGWMDFNLTVPTPWMTRDQEGLNWWEGGEDPTGGMTYQQFIEEFPVHPVCWAFDHTWEPNFFEHGAPGGGECRGTTGAPGTDDWAAEIIDGDTPGADWRDWVASHVANNDNAQPASGSSAYPVPDDNTGPNDLNGKDSDGYAYPVGTEPAPSPVGDTDDYYGGGGGGDNCETVEGQEVCDLNEDGKYRDVNGDSSVGQDDVVHFFEHQHRDAWKQPDLFDFSDSDSVGHGDVVALFEYASL